VNITAEDKNKRIKKLAASNAPNFGGFVPRLLIKNAHCLSH
jgi:hypothetical protein